jgi:hypothetical protein
MVDTIITTTTGEQIRLPDPNVLGGAATVSDVTVAGYIASYHVDDATARFLAVVNELINRGRLVTTRDKEGAKFYAITNITLSAAKPNEDGHKRKFILWSDTKPLLTIYED